MTDNNFGYGDVEKVVKETSQNTKYLQFKKDDNGRQIMIRIASEPRYIIQHWVLGADGKNRPVTCEGEDCAYCGKSVPKGDKMEKKSRWAWIVIDREDGEAKVFMGPNSIALRLRDLTKLISPKTKKPTWGDPRTFDVTITYTVKSNGFGEYKVDPDPDSRGELTAEEVKMVEESGYDLEKELQGSKKSEHVGNYKGEEDPVEVPADLGGPAKVEEDDEEKGEEDDGKGEDDETIPF